MSLNTGVRLGDRYELVARIASGGMGEVWRGRDTTLGRIVAVKVLRSEFAGDPTFIARFRAEARNTAVLSHLNIAQVYDYGEAMAEGEHVAYLVMELIDGEPLSEVLASSSRLPAPRVLDILAQTAAGLGVAHGAGVVHRDVKPANLIIRPDRTVKITDFGISRATDHVPLTGTGMVIGTAQYLSPEQAMGRPVTAASDVYALGVVGYEALAGRRPFEGESSVAIALAHVNQEPPPLPDDVPGEVRELIRRSLSKDPEQRYQDGAAFSAAIGMVSQGQPLPTQFGLPPATVPARGSAGPTKSPTGGRGGKSRTAVMPAVRAPQGRPPGRPVNYGPPPRARQAPVRQKTRTGQYVAVLVLFALVLAVGLLAVYITQNKDGTQGNSATGTSVATTEAGPGMVFVDTNAYRGQPVDEVEAALTALGLVVETQELTVQADALAAAEIEDQPFDKNDVVTTDPTQTQVPAGSTVTVYFAKKDYEPDGDGNGNGNGNGNEDDDG